MMWGEYSFVSNCKASSIILSPWPNIGTVTMIGPLATVMAKRGWLGWAVVEVASSFVYAAIPGLIGGALLVGWVALESC